MSSSRVAHDPSVADYRDTSPIRMGRKGSSHLRRKDTRTICTGPSQAFQASQTVPPGGWAGILGRWPKTLMESASEPSQAGWNAGQVSVGRYIMVVM